MLCRKGQSQVVVFILIFLIFTVLVFSTYFWSKSMFERNIDANKLSTAEQFMSGLDSKIQRVAQTGGKEAVDYGLSGTLKLIQGVLPDGTPDDIVEYESATSIELPEQWICLNTANPSKAGSISDSVSIIRENKIGGVLKIQLFYRLRSDTQGYIVDLFAEGNLIAEKEITIERNSTETKIIAGKQVFIQKIKLTLN